MTRSAFTLAEVLITLVIIGVIAAITVPTIVANAKSQTLKNQYTKAYSDLNNFSRKFYSEKGISYSEYASLHTYSENYNVIKQYMTPISRGQMKQGGSWIEDFVPPYKTSGGAKVPSVCDDIGLYATMSGSFIGINNPPKENENGPVICVDINGDKGPNRYGFDFFLFLFTLDGRAIPMGMEDVNNPVSTNTGFNFFFPAQGNCLRNAKNIRKNTTCSFYALADKHPTKPGKNYWNDFL